MKCYPHFKIFILILKIIIKGIYLEGNENEKIDEMKTVNENKLVNDSLIFLII